jgi:Nucleotidyl transferase AbiEii toxin, Type IV TA system
VSVRWRLAQKLHACIESPADDGRNERFRDLIDIVLLWDLITPADRSSVRQACEQLFELRALHPWPPRVQPPRRLGPPLPAAGNGDHVPARPARCAGRRRQHDHRRDRPGVGNHMPASARPGS